MGIKDAIGNAAIGAVAVGGFLSSNPENTPNLGQVDDAIGISRYANEPAEGRWQESTSGNV